MVRHVTEFARGAGTAINAQFMKDQLTELPRQLAQAYGLPNLSEPETLKIVAYLGHLFATGQLDTLVMEMLTRAFEGKPSSAFDVVWGSRWNSWNSWTSWFSPSYWFASWTRGDKDEF